MSSPAAAETDALPPSDVHDVLRNDRRRRVIERLRETESSAVRDLAEHIAAIESGESPPPRNVRQSVYVSLHQTHLPKLDELRIVVYDDDAKETWLAERADEVIAFLDGAPGNDGGDARRTLGVAAVGLAALGAAAALGAPWAGVGVGAAALAVVAAVSAFAAFDDPLDGLALDDLLVTDSGSRGSATGPPSRVDDADD
jgi:hypothetical protein